MNKIDLVFLIVTLAVIVGVKIAVLLVLLNQKKREALKKFGRWAVTAAWSRIRTAAQFLWTRSKGLATTHVKKTGRGPWAGTLVRSAIGAVSAFLLWRHFVEPALSSLPWGTIGSWTIVVIVAGFLVALIAYFARKSWQNPAGYLRTKNLSGFLWDATKVAVALALIVGAGYSVYWLLYGPKGEPSLARRLGGCKQLPAPTGDRADVYEIVAQPGVYTPNFCYPSGGYTVDWSAAEKDARFKLRTETGQEYSFTPEHSDRVEGYIRQHAFMALGERPETIRITISAPKGLKKVSGEDIAPLPDGIPEDEKDIIDEDELPQAKPEPLPSRPLVPPPPSFRYRSRATS